MRLVGYMAILLLGGAMMAWPAAAQTSLEPRVGKLEAEMRAVQRKVFPGSSDRFFEPEIVPQTPTGSTVGSTTSGPVADLLARVDALEAQLARLTATTEENSFKLGKLEVRIAQMEKAAADVAAAEAALAAPAPVATVPQAAKPSVTTPAAAVSRAPASRVAAVAAIARPDTGNSGEDDYTYGYRLWEAKFYPEAQQQLEKTVKTYPAHPRASHARNLLGRAYLDEGKTGTAATVFLENYQKLPRGERAADSLYYLGVAMTQRKELTKACAAFSELAEAYPGESSGRLASQIAKGRTDAKCK